MRDALSSGLRNYLSLATGMTSVTRQRAVDAARQLVSQGEATAGQVQTLAADLLETSRGNREALISLIRYEIDRALSRLGLATADEVAALRAQVHTLEIRLRATEARLVERVGVSA